MACAAALLVTSACGGGGGGSTGGGGTPPPPTGQNVTSITVDSGPAAALGVINTPYVTVTLCAPGGTACQTIDHVTLDSASSGFRVIASVLTPALAQALPQAQVSGQALLECTQFADGYVWGAVKTADLKISGEQASSIPVQVIGDSAFPAVPDACKATGKMNENTVAAFGANGILGVSVFREDCGPGCVTPVTGSQLYYTCPTSGCQPNTQPTGTVALAQQVQNAVYHFATDNNGVIIELPSISATGAGLVNGSLVFGIGTQSNNGLGTATVFALNSQGDLTTIYNNQTLGSSFIDSGSNGLFFTDASLTKCTKAVGFYCPTSTQSFSAVIQSGGITTNVSFSIASVETLTQSNAAAFNDIGGPNSTANSFDWGLPFFFGRNVFVAIEGQTTAAGTGPFVAF
jgi:hypothetical protein